MEEDERVNTADTARKRPERPWTAARTMEVLRAVSPRHCAATSALRNCCFKCRAGQSHKDNVRCTAVEEQLEAKEVQRLKATQTARRNTDCSANKEPNNCSVTAVSKTDFGKELARAPTITISPPPV